MPSIADKRRAFRKLHDAGCFVIPNPWSIGTAKYLQHLGFKALASTSAGFAHFHGLADGAVPRDLMLKHLAELVAATDLPVNADFEAGYADDPAGVAESVRFCVETGVAGLSIEDSTGDAEKPLYDLDEALARLRAARAAIDRSGSDVLLTGRAECFLVRHPDALNESIRRLVAYSQAGADCLYAPGLRTREEIAAVVRAVAPKPVNLLVGFASELTVGEISQLGVRRISVGSALARTAWTAFAKTAAEIAESGRFGGFAGIASTADLNKFFSEDRKRQ
jgi:2-methylisocitrate lyase-like PEP mutase family enzyme